jgi:CHAT domain-containing protein
MKQRWIICCILYLATNFGAAGQQPDDNLKKGRELLLVEEYHPASYYLRQAITSSKVKTVQEDAKLSLAELFLLTQQPDSANSIISQLNKTARLKTESEFLIALQNFQDNNSDLALTQFQALYSKIPAQDNLLHGKVHYYSGTINFRKRTPEPTRQSIKDLQLAVAYFKKDSLQAYLKLSLARMQLAEAYRSNKQPAAALQQLRLATSILERSPYPKPVYLANTYGVEGRILYSSGNYFNARNAFEKSLQRQLAASADSITLGITLANLALCFSDLYDYNACEKAYGQASAYWSHQKVQPDRLIPFSNNYAMFLRDIEEATTAVDGLQKVLPLLESDKLQSKKAIYQTYANLTLLYYDLDDFVTCKKYLDRLDLFVKQYPNVLDDSEMLNIKSLRAMWLRKEKKFEEAIDLCQSTESFVDSSNVNDYRRAKFYATYGDILNSADRHEQSYLQLRKAKVIYDAQENTHEQIVTDNLLAMNFFGQNQFDSVLFYSNQSLQYNAIKSKENLVYPYYLPQDAILSCYLIIISRIRQYQAQHQPQLLDKAIAYEELGIGLIRSIRKDLYSDADRISYNKNVTKFYDACCLLYLHRWQNKNNGAANKFFEYAEESKFQALTNGLVGNRVNSFKDVNEALLKEEKELAKGKLLENQQLVRLIALAPDEDEIEQRKTEARAQLKTLEKKHDRFLDSLRRNFSGYYVLKYGGKALSLDELKSELQPEQCVLQIKVIDSVVVVQVITSANEFLFQIPKADALRKDISKLRNLIQFKLQTEFVSLSNKIYQTLLSPAELELKKNKIKVNAFIIVPDDFFYLLPFEALTEQKKPLRYFIQSHAISYAYSCNLMIQNKRDMAMGLTNNFLGIAPRFRSEATSGSESRSATASFTSNMSYDDYGFQPLKENENEINLIAGLVNSKSVTRTVLSGDDANEAQIKHLDLSKYKYIHFATHGFVNTYNPGLSGLALTNTGKAGEDNILFTSEIYNLNLRADLVCLSACETGLGENAPGEGLIGLGRAFFYSGAHNLLVSLWKVPDESTSQFMIDFYQKFFNPDAHLSNSLRLAKLKMIKSSAYQNPYYWAPFVLVGSN